jgi:flagellar hook assembly protein FlgD
VLDVDLTSYFSYDIGNFYQGRFSYPVELDTGNCVITVKAADNLRNLASESVAVTVQKNQRLALDNVLYYSSPSSRTGYFTFVLSQPASVSIKVYTINGRLIKSISDRPFSFGYNQIVWDGLDEEGVPPSNGVYLYKIQARSYERGNEEKDIVIEKFIILH